MEMLFRVNRKEKLYQKPQKKQLANYLVKENEVEKQWNGMYEPQNFFMMIRERRTTQRWNLLRLIPSIFIY